MQQQYNMRGILLFSLAIHILTAVFSEGFFHPDEQYYTLDFAFFKAGLLPNYVKSWEYLAEIRPWSLPALFLPFLFVGKLITNDPFILAMGLRILCSIFSFLALNAFAFAYRNVVRKEYRRIFILLMNFLWVLLFMHARTSSENISTSFLLIGLAFLKRFPSSYLLLSGAMMGMAFNCRHQLGILVFCIAIQKLFDRSFNLKRFMIFSVGVLFVALLGVGFDSLGYEHFVLTPWNYIKVNLVENKVSQFGVHPWWQYFSWTALKITPFIGLPVLVATLWLLKRWKRYDFSLGLIVFILVHIWIGHKELRFLFPVFPILWMIFLKDLFPQIGRLGQQIIIWTNWILVPVVIFKPAYSAYGFYKELFRKEVSSIATVKDESGNHPVLELQGLIRPYLKHERFSSFEEFRMQNRNIPLFITKYREFEHYAQFGCKPVYSSKPLWLFQYNIGNWRKRSKAWMLLECPHHNL